MMLFHINIVDIIHIIFDWFDGIAIVFDWLNENGTIMKIKTISARFWLLYYFVRQNLNFPALF